jgi:hypothetical protein
MALFDWLEALPLIAAIRTTPTIYAVINAIHIVGLAMLVGAIVAADLRVLGLWRHQGWRGAVAAGSTVAATGLAIAMLTGVVLFAIRPEHYLGNVPFLVKLGLLAAGLLNVALFHLWMRRSTGERPDGVLRACSAFSISVWIAAVFSGRFIAYAA